MGRRNKKWLRDRPKFFQTFHYFYDSKAVETLSPVAYRVLNEFRRRYDGFNGDDLSITYAELEEKFGFSSATSSKAFKELVEHGLIEVKVHGGLRVGMKTKQCNIFSLSEKWKKYGKD